MLSYILSLALVLYPFPEQCHLLPIHGKPLSVSPVFTYYFFLKKPHHFQSGTVLELLEPMTGIHFGFKCQAPGVLGLKLHHK